MRRKCSNIVVALRQQQDVEERSLGNHAPIKEPEACNEQQRTFAGKVMGRKVQKLFGKEEVCVPIHGCHDKFQLNSPITLSKDASVERHVHKRPSRILKSE